MGLGIVVRLRDSRPVRNSLTLLTLWIIGGASYQQKYQRGPDVALFETSTHKPMIHKVVQG
jgi:hypothetical protein